MVCVFFGSVAVGLVYFQLLPSWRRSCGDVGPAETVVRRESMAGKTNRRTKCNEIGTSRKQHTPESQQHGMLWSGFWQANAPAFSQV